MSDILDVLNIKSFPSKKNKETSQQQNQQNLQNSSEFKQIYTSEEPNAKRRKISAMNRELYNLIGSNVPPLAIDTASVANAGSSKKFKEKLVNTKANSPWRRLGFKNSARDDDLVLFHWTKAVPLDKTNSDNNVNIGEDIPKKENEDINSTDKTEVKDIEEAKEKESNDDDKMDVDEEIKIEKMEIEMDPNEYRYVKYNTKLNIPSFTEEEYEEAMKSEKEKRKNELEAKEAKEKIKLEKEKMLAKKAESKNTPIETPTTKVTESGKTDTKTPEVKKSKKSEEEASKDKEDEKKEDVKQQDITKAAETNQKDETGKEYTKQDDSIEKTEVEIKSDEKNDSNIITDKVDDKTVSKADTKVDDTPKNDADDKTENKESDTVEDKTENVKDKTDGKLDDKIEEKAGDKSELKKDDKTDDKTEDQSTENDNIATDDKKGQTTESVEDNEENEEIKERPWTYEETKFLFDLCNDYDMRWAVIFDRYQDKYDDRILEDLKIHMYSISAHLLEKRGNLNDSALIKALRTFNKDKELERKFYLNKLIHRAPTEIAEEESLVIEARKFELAAKKMLLERAQLLQLLDSPQSSASVQQYLTSQGLTQLYNSLMSADKSKKRKAEVPVAPLLGPNAIPHTQHLHMSSSFSNNNSNSNTNNNSSNNNNGNSGTKKRSNGSSNNNSNNNAKSHSNSNTNLNNNNNNNNNNNSTANVSGNNNNNTNNSNAKPPSKLSEVQQLLQKNLTPEELEIYGIEIHSERIQPGVHVRSQKIASFKPSVQAKVHEILGQLGLSIKPTMPTGPVSKKFDELLYKISHLVDLKKQSDKLIAEIELIKRQKGV